MRQRELFSLFKLFHPSPSLLFAKPYLGLIQLQIIKSILVDARKMLEEALGRIPYVGSHQSALVDYFCIHCYNNNLAPYVKAILSYVLKDSKVEKKGNDIKIADGGIGWRERR